MHYLNYFYYITVIFKFVLMKKCNENKLLCLIPVPSPTKNLLVALLITDTDY